MSPATRYRPRTEDAIRRRALLNTLNLTTPVGLAIARLGRARLSRGPEGLWLGEDYTLRFPIAGAFTVGNVVTTARTFDDLEASTPGVLGHESRHAWQYARLGLLFFPAYAAAASWSWLRYRNLAVGNVFECQAGLVSGCYVASGMVRTSPPPLTTSLATLFRRSPRRGGAAPSGSPAGPNEGGAAA